MKPIGFSFMLLTAIAVAFLLVSDTSADEEPTFSNRDLRGEYFFNLVEIRTELIGGAPTTDYCDVAGTLNFDGIGTVVVSSTRRCSATPEPPVQPVVLPPLDYTVDTDGSFVIIVSEGPPPDLVHGQIVNRRHSLLIDGTQRTDPNLWMFHGVAMRRQLPDD